jgi:hypothetical protein
MSKFAAAVGWGTVIVLAGGGVSLSTQPVSRSIRSVVQDAKGSIVPNAKPESTRTRPPEGTAHDS